MHVSLLKAGEWEALYRKVQHIWPAEYPNDRHMLRLALQVGPHTFGWLDFLLADSANFPKQCITTDGGIVASRNERIFCAEGL